MGQVDHLDLARELAMVAHLDQTRRDGTPYINHVHRVAVRAGALSAEAGTVAYLHDVLEDTKVTATTLLQLFPEHTVVAVLYLTRTLAHETYDCYIEDLIEFGPDVALQVKLCDLADHRECAAKDGTPPRKRYQRADVAIRAALLSRGVEPITWGLT